MGLDDGVKHYKGKEAEWAALCAMDGLTYLSENEGATFKVSEAERILEEVWDFVTDSCEIEGASTPNKKDALIHLKQMIRKAWG